MLLALRKKPNVRYPAKSALARKMAVDIVVCCLFLQTPTSLETWLIGVVA
jgi:hypothetical protein